MFAKQMDPPSFMHPFSATFKSRGAHPDFSLENRRTKLESPLSSSLSQRFLDFEAPLAHPDEEKGRKHHTPQSLDFNKLDLKTIDSGITTFTPAQPLTNQRPLGNDDDFLEGWLEERSFKSTPEKSSWSPITLPPVNNPITDWSSAIDQAVNNAEERIVLSDVGLTNIPDQVWELSTIRVFESRAAVNRGTFLRTATTPFPTPFLQPSLSSERKLTKTRSESASRTAGRIQLFLAKNALTSNSLSFALFSLTNLTVLSLRDNKLERLPEGIGRLTGLVELNISLNQITYLPAEIIHLPNLTQLFLHPNPFLVAGPLEGTSPKSGRVVGPKIIHFTVPSLSETLIRSLITEADSESSRLRITDLPNWFPEHLRAPFHTILHPLQSSSFAPHSRSRSLRQTAYDDDRTGLQQPFDPLSNICRSIAHAGEERYYYTHAVERIEWVSELSLKIGAEVAGTGFSSSTKEDAKVATVGARTIPIRHRGCGPQCLDWLDD